jgi:hypothetical protein
MKAYLLVLLAFLCKAVYSQVCEEYAGSPLSFGFCDHFVQGKVFNKLKDILFTIYLTYKVFVPANTTQQYLEATVASQIKGFFFNNSQTCILYLS